MSQLYRNAKLFSRHKKKKNIIKQDAAKAIVPIALDDSREAHKNMNITPLRATYRIDPNKPLREPSEKGPEELQIDQDYSILKRRVKTFASGKIQIKYIKNNPPGKRYFPLSESKIAKGDTVEGFDITGTTFAEYTNKIKTQRKEAEEASWSKSRE
jgi:hypothetical protein